MNDNDHGRGSRSGHPGRDEAAKVRILGPLEVWTSGDWAGIGAPKWRALLAALVINAGQVVSTGQLVTELWNDDPPDRAANLVSVYVLRLRRLLGDPKGFVLATRAPGYRLRLGSGSLDADRFDALVARGRQALAARDPQRAAAALTEALGLWRGRAFADVPPTALVTTEAARLEESRLSALELRVEADLGRGLHAQVVPELRGLVADQPLREGLWSLLIRALDGAGRHAEALAAYGQVRKVISDELGVDPGPELRALHRRLLTADAVVGSGPHSPDRERAAMLPAAGSAGSAGTGGTARPSAAGAAGPGSAAPAGQARSAPPPAQLPADVPDFTGRHAHVQELRAVLAGEPAAASPTAVPVAVVAGTPGLGKTALAVHAAHGLRSAFPDGQLYVSLLGASQQPVPPEEVLARFLRDLGVDGARVPVGLEERAALYRTRLSGRRMLVVLDDAADAAQVRPLLPGSLPCAVIVTSRRRLSHLAGSHLVDLDVLDDDDARRLLTRITGTSRTDAEPEAVRDVLAACAGLPLAIRIAGARLSERRGWTIRALADRLADQRRRIDELTAGDLAVRACFQVSFAALPSPTGQDGVDPARAFRLLGVWEGPSIGLRAAVALIGRPEPDVRRALEVLVDAHLLESPAPDRYRFHDLLRAYAAEQARADEPPQVIADAERRVLAWYLHTADAAASAVSPHGDRVPLDRAEPGCEPLAFGTADEALEWCRQERGNLVAATRQAADNGLHDVAWKLPVAVMICFDLLGYRAEWLATHSIALASARQRHDRRGEAWALNNLGMVLGEQRTDDAIGYFEQALAIHRETGDRKGQGQAANNLAFCYRFLGRHEEAAVALLDALKLQRQVHHRYGEAITLCNLGEAYIELGRPDEAIERSQEGLAIARQIGSVRLEGYAFYNIGRAHVDLGRRTEAAGLLEQALARHRDTGDRYGEAQDLKQLGAVYARTGRAAEARATWTRARALFGSLGDDLQAEDLRIRLSELGVEPAQA